MQDIKEIFGKNVQKFRRQHNMTQEQLAEMLDISQAFLANIERGKRGVSMETIEMIAFIVYGAAGGQIDHTLGNFSLLLR